MNIEQSKSIELIGYLKALGYTPCKEQNNNLWYLSPFRSEKTPSFKVNTARNQWYDFGIGKGGDIIAFIMEIHHTDVTGALKVLDCKPTTIKSFSFRQQEYSHRFEDIKVKPLTNPSLLEYIRKRQVSKEIAAEQCKEIHYKFANKFYFAIGFMNDMKGYELRNPYFKGCTSKSISTINNHSDTCMVFEGFMDYLSYLTLNKGTDLKIDFAILNSVANLSKALEFITSHKKIHVYLDNDEAGIKATQEIKKSCSEVYDESHQYNGYKDLNEMLCNRKH